MTQRDPSNPNASTGQRRATGWMLIAVLGLTLLIVALIEPPPKARIRLEGKMDRLQIESILAAREAELGQALEEEQKNRLLDSLLNQELLFEEGVRQGLLERDPVVKRRVVELVLEQTETAVGEPTEDELSAFYRDHASRYRLPAQWRFRQLFFPASDFDEERVGRESNRIRNAGESNDLIAQWPHRLRAHDDSAYYHRQSLENLYGPSFAKTLEESDPDAVWVGPLSSGLGWHLLKITGRRAGRVQSFESVRAIVRRDWRQERRREETARLIDRLRRQGNPLEWLSR